MEARYPAVLAPRASELISGFPKSKFMSTPPKTNALGAVA